MESKALAPLKQQLSAAGRRLGSLSAASSDNGDSHCAMVEDSLPADMAGQVVQIAKLAKLHAANAGRYAFNSCQRMMRLRYRTFLFINGAPAHHPAPTLPVTGSTMPVM